MNDEPEILFGHVVRGFSEWYREHYAYLQTLFTKDAERQFESIEDFAVEVYLTLKCGYDPEPAA
jgi:hypothetical protein